jgi:hypothetical protein
MVTNFISRQQQQPQLKRTWQQGVIPQQQQPQQLK